MAAPATPSNFVVQTADAKNLVSWDQTPTATSYEVFRSLDNIAFTSIATPALPQYEDIAVTVGIKYWYRVTAVNIDGSSPPTSSLSAIPTPTGELSLERIRNLAKERADRLNSEFVTNEYWNSYINQAMFELYDLLVTVYEDYFLATPLEITVNGNNNSYDLPDGVNYSGAPAFYKIMGVDLALNTQPNGWVTVDKYNFLDRNRFVYPNTASTLYGVFNVQYRIMGNKITLIPTPSAGQKFRIHYVPRLKSLLKDTDFTTIGVSGWLEYVIVRAAKYALDKEESDSSVLTQELLFLKQRIEEAASNRDAGRPDRITDTRLNGFFGSGMGGVGWNGPSGGFVFAFLSLGTFLLKNIGDLWA